MPSSSLQHPIRTKVSYYGDYHKRSECLPCDTSVRRQQSARLTEVELQVLGISAFAVNLFAVVRSNRRSCVPTERPFRVSTQSTKRRQFLTDHTARTHDRRPFVCSLCTLDSIGSKPFYVRSKSQACLLVTVLTHV